MRYAVIAAALGTGLALLSGTVANATIIFATGNPGGSFDNVIFTNNPPPGTTVQGVLNSTPYNVTFTGNETLVAPSNGQARIEAQTPGLNYIEYTLGTGLGSVVT